MVKIVKSKMLNNRKTFSILILSVILVGLTNSISPTVASACSSGSYKNADGNCVKSPVKSNNWPTGTTAKCGDGTYSYSQSRRGTCSHHGGVAQWR
jgi:hypothetical protein